MTESAEPSSGAQVTGAPAGPSAGQLIRRAREAAGMHIGTLAVTLKVPVKRLEALESDRWDLLPDAVFARALAASVCRTLKVDAALVLERLPAAAPRLMVHAGGVNTPYREGAGAGAGSSVMSHLSRPLGLAVLAMLLGALGLVFWPGLPGDPIDAGKTANPTTRSAGAAVAVREAPVEATTASQPASPSSGPLAPGATGTGASGAPVSTEPASASAPSAAANEPRSPSEAPPLPLQTKPELKSDSAEVVVVFRTTGQSWIQVVDAGGAVLLKKLMGAGESASAAGVAPLSVLVGRVDVTRVEIRGKPFDMTPVARENVARFEVKP